MLLILKKYRKKAAYTLLILLFGNVFLFGNLGGGATQTTWAAVWPTQSTEQRLDASMRERAVYAATFNKILYIIIRPLLVVAGWAMDNGMVYGEMFWFDSALRNIRSLTRNIANFALWFLFLYCLFKNMFKGDTTKELKNLITHTLIAGVLIQASRFLTAVAIDISTVATYGIGGMPISILGNEGTEKELDRPLLGVRISEDISKLNIDLKSLSNLHLFMVTEDNQLISPCHLRPFTDTTTSGSETLIIWRSYIYWPSTGKDLMKTMEEVCHYNGNIYIFAREQDFKTAPNKVEEKDQPETQQSNYENNIKTLVTTNNRKDKTRIENEIRNGYILQISGPQRSRVFTEPSNTEWKLAWLIKPQSGFVGLDSNMEFLSGTNWATLTTISQLLNKSSSYVGVFSILYSTLLSANEVGLTDRTNIGTYETVINTTVNTIYTLVLAVPLIALVVVLLARIFILWVVIAIAPIIILLKIFEKEIGSNLIGKDSVFALDNIRKLLLAPVLISFALSLSTMFIMILKSLPSVTPPNDTMSILGLFEINIKGAGANISQLIIRVIGLGLVRFLLFWAIEQNKIWASIGKKLKSTAENFMGSIPIVPFPWGALWYNQVIGDGPNTLLGKMESQVSKEMNKQHLKNVENTIFGWLYKDELNSMYAQEKTKYQTSVISKLDTDTILRGIGEQGETFAVKYNINNKGEVSEVGNGDKKMDLSISDLADSAVYKEVIAKLENAYKTENDNKKRNNYKTVFINTIKKATDKSVVESLIKVDTSSTGNGKEAIRKDLVGNKRTFTDTQNGTKTTFKLNDQGKLEKENVTTPPTTTTPTPTAPTPTTPTPTTPAPTS